MDPETLVSQFEENRSHLRAVAFRITGNLYDADDALQSAWLTTRSTAPDTVERPAAWLTTVTSREALGVLRRRRRQAEVDIDRLDDHAAADPGPAEEALWVESVGRALLVVLDRLSPAQRAAFVMHDLFAMPFEDIAVVLQRSPVAAKKLASRARSRIRPPHDSGSGTADTVLVKAYLDASRDGDIATLLTLLAPDVVRISDSALLPPHVAPVIRGRDAIADQTRYFADRAAVSVVALVDGAPAVLIAPRGRLVAAMLFTIEDGEIYRIRVVAAADLISARLTLTASAGA
jgi:RNA polymerase sigma-70 factor, ECF subfamily